MMAYSSSIRTLLIATWLFSEHCCAVSDDYSFGPTYTKIAGYSPVTKVSDQAAIDLDQQLIESLLSEERLEDAMEVYKQGSFSRSYAELHVQTLANDIPGHSLVTGKTVNGEPVQGITMIDGKKGDSKLKILYETSGDQQHHVNCQVGGNPEPHLDGCFHPSGHIIVDDLMNLTYSYVPSLGNKNERTIQGFSTHADVKMRPCPHCDYWHTFANFRDFYGSSDYADRWIGAAASGDPVAFDSVKADFSRLGVAARAAAIKTMTVTMAVSMYFVQELEVSVKECMKTCSPEGCSDKALKALDGAVASYTGSLEGKDGSGHGKLLYDLADRECKEFKTCGTHGDSIKGTSKANLNIFLEFDAMQHNLTARACPAALLHKDHISRLMFIPLVQGTLRYAHMLSYNKDVTEEDRAVGAAFATSVAPMVAACGYQDGQAIIDQMAIDAESTDFRKVKDLFEKHYDCLEVKCADIGGYWDNHKRKYHRDAEPCTFDPEEDHDSGLKPHHHFMIAFLLLSAAFGIYCYCCRGTSKRSRKSGDDDDDDDSIFSSSSYDSNFEFT